jgi:hypothetical protein
LAESLQTEVMELPWSAAQGLAAMRGHIQVLHEDSAETLTVTVRGRPAALAKLRSRVANQAVQ